MNALFGPRTEEVDRFLERLQRLTPRQLHRVIRNGASTDYPGTAEALGAADAAACRHGRHAALEAVAEATRRALEQAPFPDGAEAFRLARFAGAALALRDLITWPDFVVLYRPFFQVVPPASLKRQTDFGPSAAMVECFLTRLKKLTESQWSQVLGAHRLRVPGPVPTPDDLRTECAAAQVDAAVTAGRGWDRVVGKKPGRAMAKQAAQDAVKSLVLRNRISAECFAALYAPFASIIPVAALPSRGGLWQLLHAARRQLERAGLGWGQTGAGNAGG